MMNFDQNNIFGSFLIGFYGFLNEIIEIWDIHLRTGRNYELLAFLMITTVLFILMTTVLLPFITIAAASITVLRKTEVAKASVSENLHCQLYRTLTSHPNSKGAGRLTNHAERVKHEWRKQASFVTALSNMSERRKRLIGAQRKR